MKKISWPAIIQGLVVFVFTASITYYVAVPRAFSGVKDSINTLSTNMAVLNGTMERIEPLVNEWVRASGVYDTEIKAIKKTQDELNTRVRELETGG